MIGLQETEMLMHTLLPYRRQDEFTCNVGLLWAARHLLNRNGFVPIDAALRGGMHIVVREKVPWIGGCPQCGGVFRTDREQKYCSHACYIAHRFGGVLS